MPTIISHPAVPLALGFGLGGGFISIRLLICGVIGSTLPDLDVLAFRLGIPYAAAFGHRGFSHSLLFAFIVALLTACSYKPLRTAPIKAFGFMCIAVGSHGILDTFTNGGLGVGLLWPWSENRFFAPFQPIEVAPLNPARFLTERGTIVIQSELFWVWLPSVAFALMAFVFALIVRNRRNVPKVRVDQDRC